MHLLLKSESCDCLLVIHLGERIEFAHVSRHEHAMDGKLPQPYRYGSTLGRAKRSTRKEQKSRHVLATAQWGSGKTSAD